MKWLFSQLEGPAGSLRHGTWRENNGKHWMCKFPWWKMWKSWKVYVDGWEDRDDCTVVDVGNSDSEVIETMNDFVGFNVLRPEVPSECIGYVTGARRAALGNMEEERFWKLQKNFKIWSNFINFKQIEFVTPKFAERHFGFWKDRSILASSRPRCFDPSILVLIYFTQEWGTLMFFMNKEAMHGGKAGPCFRKVGRFRPDLNLNPTSTPLNLSMLLTHSNIWLNAPETQETCWINADVRMPNNFILCSIIILILCYSMLKYKIWSKTVQNVQKHTKKHETKHQNMALMVVPLGWKEVFPIPRAVTASALAVARSSWPSLAIHGPGVARSWRQVWSRVDRLLYFICEKIIWKKTCFFRINCDKVLELLNSDFWLNSDWFWDLDGVNWWIVFGIGFNMICHHNCVFSVWIAPSSDHVLLKKTDKQFFVSQIEVQED